MRLQEGPGTVTVLYKTGAQRFGKARPRLLEKRHDWQKVQAFVPDQRSPAAWRTLGHSLFGRLQRQDDVAGNDVRAWREDGIDVQLGKIAAPLLPDKAGLRVAGCTTH